MTMTVRPDRSPLHRACSAARSRLPSQPVHATAAHGRSRRGSASPGRPAGWPSSGAGKMGLPLAAQFAEPRLARDRRGRPGGRRRRDQRGPLARRRGAGPRRGRPDGPRGRPPPGDDGRRRRGPRERRRRADRAGHARRRAAARLPLHGLGRRRRSRRASTRARTSSSRRRCRSATPATGSRRGSRRRAGLARRRGLLRRVLAGAAVSAAPSSATSRRTPSSSAASGRRRRIAPSRSTRRSSTPTSCRMSSAEAAEFSQARRHDLPRREHRPRQRVRALRRPGRRRHPGSHRGGEQPAVQPHPPAGPRASAATASRSTRTSCSSRAPEMELVGLSRRINDGQVGVAIRTIQKVLGGLEGVPVLVLGLTYREGVHELAYSRALPLIERLAFHGAIVSACDPLLDRRGDRALRRDAVALGRRAARVRAIVTQTADPRFRDARLRLVPGPRAPLRRPQQPARTSPCPTGVAYHGVGVQRPGSRRPVAPVGCGLAASGAGRPRGPCA